MLLCRVSINAALLGTQIRKRPEVLANEKNGLWWSLVTQNCFGLRLSKGSQIRVRVEDNLWFQELHDRTVLCVHFPGRHEPKTFYTREGSNVKSQYGLYQYSVWWSNVFIVATFRAFGFANKTINDSESEASQESPPLHE